MGSTTDTPPAQVPTDIWPFTEEQMLDFRVLWIRDMVAINALQAVVIDDGGGGTGYVQSEPLIVQADPTDSTGSNAAGYVNVTNGAVTSIKMTRMGSLYTADPIVTVDTVAGLNAAMTSLRATVKLSAWNKATSQQYFSDTDINGLLYVLLTDRRSELIAAYYSKLNEGRYEDIQLRQSDLDADVYATREQLSIIYRFLRADCREAMMNDPGFQGTIPDMRQKDFFAQWNGAIMQDRNWGRSRTGGFASVARVIR